MKKHQISVFAILLTCAQTTFAQPVEDLTGLSLEQLLNVSITGASKYEQKQSEVAADASVINRNDIKKYGWRTLSEALNSLPGLYSTYDRQYNYLGARGFGLPGDYNTRVLITINGNRINDDVYDQGNVGRDFPLDVDLIERIEFIPGPGGAIYGQNATLGVVNVVTRKGSEVNGAEVAASYQSPQSAPEGRVTWGMKLDNGTDALFSATGYYSKGKNLYFDYPGANALGLPSSGIATGMDGENGKTFLVQLARGPWSFDLNYGDRRKGDPTSTFISDPLAQGQYQQDRKLNTQLQYQDYLDNTLQLTGRLYMGQERYFGWYSNSGVWSLSSGSGDWRGGEFRLLSTRWDNHKVLLGLEYQDNSRQDQALEYPAIPANNTYIPGSGWRWGVYVQDEWVISKTLSSTLGVRVDDNNMTGKSLSPRAGLVWHVAPETILKALYGQAYRAPNVYERNYGDGVTQVANPGLIGEKINTLEFGIDQRVGHNMSLHGSIYQWHMDHLITLDEDPVSGLPQYQNTGNATALGLELSANKSWDSGSRLSGSIAFQKSHYNSGGDVPNSPHMMDKLNFSSPLTATGFLLGSEVQYYSRRETDINGKYVGGYTLFNLNLIADKWVKQMEVSLGFYNLFDKHYSLPAADFNWQNTLEQDGRQIRLKAVYTF